MSQRTPKKLHFRQNPCVHHQSLQCRRAWLWTSRLLSLYAWAIPPCVKRLHRKRCGVREAGDRPSVSIKTLLRAFGTFVRGMSKPPSGLHSQLGQSMMHLFPGLINQTYPLTPDMRDPHTVGSGLWVRIHHCPGHHAHSRFVVLIQNKSRVVLPQHLQLRLSNFNSERQPFSQLPEQRPTQQRIGVGTLIRRIKAPSSVALSGLICVMRLYPRVFVLADIRPAPGRRTVSLRATTHANDPRRRRSRAQAAPPISPR